MEVAAEVVVAAAVVVVVVAAAAAAAAAVGLVSKFCLIVLTYAILLVKGIYFVHLTTPFKYSLVNPKIVSLVNHILEND